LLGGFEIELSEATFDEIIIMISEAEKRNTLRRQRKSLRRRQTV